MFSATLNADVVAIHMDKSRAGDPLAEMEALFNVTISPEDAEFVGLGKNEPLPSREKDTHMGLLFLLNYGVLVDNRPDLDIMFVDLRSVRHCVVSSGDPARLRGHWSTNAPLIGVADHRNGKRLETADKDRRRVERTIAREKGGAAVAVCRRQQIAELEVLHQKAKEAAARARGAARR
jgi:hypothetical protein